jgi:hypothetical protein
MYTNGFMLSYVYSTRSKGRVREEHGPLTYEQTPKTCVSHSSTGLKGLVHQEHEPLNDEQVKNNEKSSLYTSTTLYEIAK